MFYPNIEKISKYYDKYTHIPLVYEQHYETKDIVSIYNKYKDKYSMLLETSTDIYGNNITIITTMCSSNYKVIDNEVYIDNKKINTGIIDSLKDYLDFSSPKYDNLDVFTGGVVGHFNYETFSLFENIQMNNKVEHDLPMICLMKINDLIVINHDTNKLYFISNIDTSDDIKNAYTKAEQAIIKMIENYKQITYVDFCYIKNSNDITSNFTQKEFVDRVNKAKEYIYNGDIFQVVLSQRLTCSYEQDPLNAYKKLNINTKSLYKYNMIFDNYSIVGVSPEELLQIRDNKLKTIPIAGTRRRGNNNKEDKLIEQDLLSDKKEVAEHMMLVDLGRNDIGKVSKIGSVYVKNLLNIKKYESVMHITSEIESTLDNNKNMIDALGSMLPAGTLSGAPKIKACSIIEELENVKREAYGGALAFIGFNSLFNTCITIRTMIFKDNKVSIQAGAGIVKDSIAINEYNETLQKANVLLKAILGDNYDYINR